MTERGTCHKEWIHLMPLRWLLLFLCQWFTQSATCISWGGAEAGNNSITRVWQSLPPSSSAPIMPPLHPSSGHSQRSCPLPSGMWMCIMEMDGGWLCHTVEQTNSSLNACLPASISLPSTAPRNRAQAQYWPGQVFVCVCALLNDLVT